MIRKNLNPTKGLVNGTIGILSAIEKDIHGTINTITIQLKSGEKFPIDKDEVKFMYNNKIYIERKQFPFCLSYGITIHKSQGLSLENAVIDIGDAAFDFGQYYVALSRVTKLQGLHLVNFNPSKIKACPLSILEYNRLRQLYRPDLPHLSVQNLNITNIRDRTWAVSKHVLQAQRNQLYNDEAYEVYKIITNDTDTTFFNIILQVLFHLKIIRMFLNNCSEDIIKNSYMQYNSKNSINLLDLKSSINFENLHENNINNNNLPKFLKNLFSKSNISKFVLFKSTKRIACNSCNYEKETSSTKYIFKLSIPENYKNETLTLQEIIAYNSNYRTISTQCGSKKCNNENLLLKINDIVLNSVVVLQLKLFHKNLQSGKITKISDCKIKGIPQAKIIIAGQVYKVTCAIFHTFDKSNKEHFNAFLRVKTTKWVKVDQSSSKECTWPKCAKDVYFLFLEKEVVNIDFLNKILTSGNNVLTENAELSNNPCKEIKNQSKKTLDTNTSNAVVQGLVTIAETYNTVAKNIISKKPFNYSDKNNFKKNNWVLEIIDILKITKNHESLNLLQQLLIKYQNNICSMNYNQFPFNFHEIYKPHGLPNKDGVSCYANSIIQSLFNIQSIRRHIISSENNFLKVLYTIYALINNSHTNRLQILSKATFCFRKFIGSTFEAERQQCVADFLLHIFYQIKFLSKIFEFKYLSTLTCTKCGDVTEQPSVTDHIIQLAIPASASLANVSLQEIINYNFKENEVEARCVCGNVNKMKKDYVDIHSSVIILHLKLFEVVNEIIFKKTNLNLTDITQYVEISKYKFSVKGVISHLGNTFHRGHYINSMYDKTQDLWTTFNDDSIPQYSRSFLRVGDPYLIYLEKL